MDASEQWDWVSEWVERPPANVSHSLCPICLSYHDPLGE